MSNLLAGTYVLTVTDDNDCIYNESYVITQPEEIITNETISDYNGFQVSVFGASDGEISLDIFMVQNNIPTSGLLLVKMV